MTLSLIAVRTSSRRRVIEAHILHTRVSHPTTPDFNLGRNFGGIIDLDQSGTIDSDRGYSIGRA